MEALLSRLPGRMGRSAILSVGVGRTLHPGFRRSSTGAVFDGGSQNFRNAPGLSEAAAWMMGWIAVEDFGDMSEAGFGQVTGQRF